MLHLYFAFCICVLLYIVHLMSVLEKKSVSFNIIIDGVDGTENHCVGF